MQYIFLSLPFNLPSACEEISLQLLAYLAAHLIGPCSAPNVIGGPQIVADEIYWVILAVGLSSATQFNCFIPCNVTLHVIPTVVLMDRTEERSKERGVSWLLKNPTGRRWMIAEWQICFQSLHLPIKRKHSKYSHQVKRYIKKKPNIFFAARWLSSMAMFCGPKKTIADICHHRHHQRWCTFFKPVPLLA